MEWNATILYKVTRFDGKVIMSHAPHDLTQAQLVLTVNGTDHALDLDNRTTLLDVLREHLDLTGSKKGCDHGQCGACTVLLDGRRANACLLLAVSVAGRKITTIEGLGTPEDLHPMQQAFLDHDGYQCGYCTPGQICSAVGALAEAVQGWPSVVTDETDRHPTMPADGGIVLDEHEIRERMSGNLCRCGAYPNIVAAVAEQAAKVGIPTAVVSRSEH